jgi:hypothetical protein
MGSGVSLPQNQACLIIEGDHFHHLLMHAVDCGYTVKPIIMTLINVTPHL